MWHGHWSDGDPWNLETILRRHRFTARLSPSATGGTYGTQALIFSPPSSSYVHHFSLGTFHITLAIWRYITDTFNVYKTCFSYRQPDIYRPSSWRQDKSPKFKNLCLAYVCSHISCCRKKGEVILSLSWAKWVFMPKPNNTKAQFVKIDHWKQKHKETVRFTISKIKKSALLTSNLQRLFLLLKQDPCCSCCYNQSRTDALWELKTWVFIQAPG